MTAKDQAADWDRTGRLLMVGDVHVSDRPPSTRTSSYRKDILTKLVQIGEKANDCGAHGVVFVGDIFHSKKPEKTSHQTVRAVAQILQSYPCPVYIVPGNHDYAARNVSTLSKHPLGTVALMPNVRLFGTEGRELRLNLGGNRVRLRGVREEDPLTAFMVPLLELGDGGDGYRFDETPVITVAHHAIFPPGKKPEVWEAVGADEIDFGTGISETGAPHLCYYGHIHEPHGVYFEGGTLFANLGAISRGSLHEEGALERPVNIGLVHVSDSNIAVDRVPLEVRPASEVFRIEEVTAERAESSENNAFVEALSAAEVEVFSVERAVKQLSEHPDVAQPVRERAIELIREVTG